MTAGLGRAGVTWRDRRGSAALNFAVVAPMFFILLFGSLYIALTVYYAAALQYAAQRGARCASVNTTQCSDSASTIAYASASYRSFGGSGTPTFTYAQKTCGNSVSATMTYAWNFGLFASSTPLSASSCFPLNN